MKFSILTPSFGYGRFIDDCVRSVLDQDGVDVEHVVADGASVDETVDVLESLSADRRLKWESDADDGQSDALNKALRRAVGDWIGWLNADEFYLPGTLAAVREASESSDAVDVVYGDFFEVDATGRVLRLVAEHQFSRTALRGRCYIPSCATFVRRDAAPDRLWDVRCRSMMDWDWFLDLAAAGARFRHLPKPLAAFRRHGDQVTASAVAQTIEEYNLIRIRHGIPPSGPALAVVTAAGRGAHILRKVGEGGYVRELRAQRLKGRSLRWFDSAREPVAADAVQMVR